MFIFVELIRTLCYELPKCNKVEIFFRLKAFTHERKL